MRVVAIALTALATAMCVAGQPAPVCEASASVRELAPNADSGLSQPERVAKIRAALARRPGDLILNRWLIEAQPKPYTGVLANEFRSRPDGGGFRDRYLSAYALVGRDTPAAIKSLQSIVAGAPRFPWPYVALADIYSSAAFRDSMKVAANLRAFHGICPEATDGFEYLSVIEDPRALRELAADLRAILSRTTEPGKLGSYRALWSAELRLAWPSETDRARAAIGADAKRLEAMPQSSDVRVPALLYDAYRLSGQADEQRRIGEKLEAASPRDPAYEAYRAWEKDNPQLRRPDGWKEYGAALYQASGEWVRKWPHNAFAWDERRQALMDTNSHSAEDWKAVADGLKPSYDDHYSFRQNTDWDWMAADVMLMQVVADLQDLLAWTESPPPPQSDLISGTVTADLEARRRSDARFGILLTLSEAYLKLKWYDLARFTLARMRQWLDTDFRKYYDQAPMNSPDNEGRYIGLMARLAEAEGHKMDALTWYGQLMANPWYMREYGLPKDHVHELFRSLGGSEESWKAWWKEPPWPDGVPNPPRGMPMPAWRVVNQPLPEMDIPDATGHIWTSADFRGRTTLVSICATWCGPCWRMLPGVEKAYEAVEGRDDVRVIALTVDDEPDAVQRFMKEHHYSFPALVGRRYVDLIEPDVAMGTNWLVDKTGRIRRERYDGPYSEQTFADEAVYRLNHPPQ